MTVYVTVTFFDNYAATTKREERLTLTALAELIRTTDADTKERLPWLKLAKFGDARTDKNSLRHNGNVLAILGVEGDADSGEISLEAAVQLLRAAGILVLIYTSPSHTEDAPRWRAICPLSQEYQPDQRDRFMGRLNGVLRGVLANESWTLSQSYYYGSVHRNPSHQVLVIEGEFIDLADHLDASAIRKPVRPGANGDGRQGGPATRSEDITDTRIRGLVESLLDNVRNAADGNKHHTLFAIGRTLGGYLHVIGWSQHQAVEQLVAALPASVVDWDAARKTAAEAVALGATQPLALEDRRMAPGQRRDTDAGPNGRQTSVDDQSKLDPEVDEREPEFEDEPLVDAALPDLFVLKADLPLVSQKLRDRLAAPSVAVRTRRTGPPDVLSSQRKTGRQKSTCSASKAPSTPHMKCAARIRSTGAASATTSRCPSASRSYISRSTAVGTCARCTASAARCCWTTTAVSMPTRATTHRPACGAPRRHRSPSPTDQPRTKPWMRSTGCVRPCAPSRSRAVC